LSGGRVGRTSPETTEDSRTGFNRILCTSKSEAAVTSNKNCAVDMLKLTTDQHEASRGLCVTAELLVLMDATLQLAQMKSDHSILFQAHKHQLDPLTLTWRGA